MRHDPVKAGVTVAAAALALALAACGGGTPASTSTSTTSTTTTTTTTTVPPSTTSPTPSTVASTTTSSSVAAVAACATAPLTVTSSTGQGAAGTLTQRFVVTNTGSAACTVNGYPFVSAYGPQTQDGGTVEATLPINVRPIPAGYGDLGAAGGTIQLAGGGTAVFFLKWTDVQSSGTSCYKVDGFDFRSPQAASGDQKLVKASLGYVCGAELQESQMFPPSVTG